VSNVYWAGRQIAQNSTLVPSTSNYLNMAGTDRLGSLISDGTTSKALYLPYGEDINSSANDRVKFATYTRDGSTGLDYADQRFYTSQFGRFMSADRFKQAASANDSGSWNKYAYTRGDPVNRKDRNGTCDTDLTSLDFDSGSGGDTGCDDNSGGGDNDVAATCAANNLVYDPNSNSCVEPQGTSVNCSATPNAPGCQGGNNPDCPLEAPTGNYKVAPGVTALFAPDFAFKLDEVFAFVNGEGIVPLITSGFRTAARQQAVQGSANGAAPVGTSWHQVGEAIDINHNDPNFAVIKATFTYYGLTWGGTFNHVDPVHFQNALPGTSPSAIQVANCAREHP